MLSTADTATPFFHDIRDPLGFVNAIVNEHRRKVPHLEPEFAEELTGEMTLLLCRLARRYDPAKSPSGQSLSTFAGRIMRRRIPDVYRKHYGDSRYGGAVRCESLDAADKELAGEVVDLDALESVNVARLTPRGQRTMRMLVEPHIETGRDYADIAAEKGFSPRWAAAEIKDLRREVEAQWKAA